MNSPQFAIETRDLVIVRGGNQVIGSLSTRVESGRVTGLLGPSGSGKTTFIRAVAGIQIIRSGIVEVLGSPAGAVELRDRLEYVTQASSVYPDLTVLQNLKYFAELAGADDAAIEAALDAVDLRGKRTALTGNLSGGERTRVSLAAALLADPELYLLDEPTVGLDPVLRRDLWQLFADLAARGRTLLVSSHVMDEAARCDRVLLLREGRLLADDTPDGLRSSTGHDDLEHAFLTLAEQGGTRAEREPS